MPANPAASAESAALLGTLGEVRPDAPTACSAWNVHDIVAHLAAGAKEHADLIEHRLSGRPERGTRGFEERELPFRALDHDTLMARLADEIRRKQRAYEDLAASADPRSHSPAPGSPRRSPSCTPVAKRLCIAGTSPATTTPPRPCSPSPSWPATPCGWWTTCRSSTNPLRPSAPEPPGRRRRS
jgi:hypothetical protein